MALIFKDIPAQGGGWFKPAEHCDAVAMLVEVTGFERQRPTPNGPKDSALVTISVFPTQADLAAGKPVMLEGTRIEQTVLAADLAGLVGSATVVTVTQIPSKKPGQHPAWVWRTVDANVRGQVVAFATEREAKVQAAIAGAPDFG